MVGARGDGDLGGVVSGDVLSLVRDRGGSSSRGNDGSRGNSELHDINE